MEESDLTHEIDQSEDNFFDALDHFHFPFLDDSNSDDTNQSTPGESSPSVSSPATICNGYSNPESSCISSDTVPTHNFNSRYDGENFKIYRDLKENEKNLDYSGFTREILDNIDSFGVANADSAVDKKTAGNSGGVAGEFGDSPYENLILFIAELVVKAIGFKVNLFVSLLMFPIWGLYNSYMLVVDPFGAMKRGRGFVSNKVNSIWNLTGGTITPLLSGCLNDQQSMGELVMRFGYAIFWSSYVCVVLCGLLVFSTLASGFVMKFIVENPIEIREELNFDYTQKSPVAYVPLMSCGGLGCGFNCEGKNLGSRAIPSYQNLQVNLQLTLPESTYNKNLGIFQVRVDLLAADGKVIASKRQPCMLKFKSELVQTVATFFKIAPLLTGYMSETQTLNINIRGITERVMPTSCLRVVLEQRAEYQPGAGIPEIYDASLKLESELTFVKRVIWSWRKTIFVWITMMLFTVKLIFALIFCRSLLVPGTRQSDVYVVPPVNNLTLQDRSLKLD